MRQATIAYTAFAIWVFGWLAGIFGLLPSLFASVILGLPAFFACRLVKSGKAIKRREYVYLAAMTTVSAAAAAFLVTSWYGAGVDRLVIFEREYQSFRREVAAIPELRNVEVSYTQRKGVRVYLHGSVASEYSHRRLIKMIEEMIRYDDGGYYDGVRYPGKKSSSES